MWDESIQSLVKKVQPGIFIQFEQLPAKNLKDGVVQDLKFQMTKENIHAVDLKQKNMFSAGF